MIRTAKINEITEAELLDRRGGTADVSAAVAEIISAVRSRGDAALRDYTLKFDRAEVENIEVSAAEIDAAVAAVGGEFIRILTRARDNIADFHKNQIRRSFVVSEHPGVVMGQKVLPLASVGIYVPGGTAAYPSSLLMNAVPAKLAGVGQTVMVTPPSGGAVADVILAAARVAGVDRIFRVGGAQAIAALAYGTGSIPAVDKIVGPGNAFVAEAKRQVSGIVGIDMIAGPSEILVIADGSCNPVIVAADMLSQAEHDRRASAILITDSEALAARVAEELERQLAVLPRREIARESIEKNGLIVISEGIGDAIDLSNRLAPEHLEICVDEPFAWLDRVRNAGSVFLGKNCPEALGDYMAGPNHVLPTGGTARFSSPLSVDDFTKKMQFTYFTAGALASLADDIDTFARAEGLDAHARSVTRRMGATYE